MCSPRKVRQYEEAFDNQKRIDKGAGFIREQVWTNYKSCGNQGMPLMLADQETFSSHNLTNEESTVLIENGAGEPEIVDNSRCKAQPNAVGLTIPADVVNTAPDTWRQPKKSRQVFTFSSRQSPLMTRYQRHWNEGVEIFESTGGTIGEYQTDELHGVEETFELGIGLDNNLRPLDSLSSVAISSEPSSFARLLISMPIDGHKKPKKIRQQLSTINSSNKCFPADRNQSDLLYDVSSGSILSLKLNESNIEKLKRQSTRKFPAQRFTANAIIKSQPVNNISRDLDGSKLPEGRIDDRRRSAKKKVQPSTDSFHIQERSTSQPGTKKLAPQLEKFATITLDNFGAQQVYRKMMSYAKFGPSFKLAEECYEGSLSHCSSTEKPAQTPVETSQPPLRVEKTSKAFRTRRAPTNTSKDFIHQINPDFVESQSLTEMCSSCASTSGSLNIRSGAVQKPGEIIGQRPKLPKRSSLVMALWKRQVSSLHDTIKSLRRLSKVTLNRAFISRTNPDEVSLDEQDRTNSRVTNEDSFLDAKRADLMNDFMIKAHHYMRLRSYQQGDAKRYYARTCGFVDKSTQYSRRNRRQPSFTSITRDPLDKIEYVTFKTLQISGRAVDSDDAGNQAIQNLTQEYADESENFRNCLESHYDERTTLGTMYRTTLSHFGQSTASSNDNRTHNIELTTEQKTYHVDCMPSLIDRDNSPGFPQDFYAVLNERRVRLKYEDGTLSIYKEPCRARRQTVWSLLAGKATDFLISVVHKNTPDPASHKRHQRKVQC